MLDTQFTTFFLDLEEVCVTSSSNVAANFL